MRDHKLAITGIIMCLLFLFQGPAEAKFINHFMWRIGGNSLSPGDEHKIAKCDIIFVKKSHYDDIRGDSWGAIKSINPNAEIYLVTHAIHVDPDFDSRNPPYINNMARYNISRGHSMGSLNRDNPGLFLRDSNNQRVVWNYAPNDPGYVLDFGDSRFQSYAVEATVADNVNHPWTADGVYSDQMFARVSGVYTIPLKYNTDALWNSATNSFINAMTAGLAAHGQKFAGNRGHTRHAPGMEAWIALDSSANPPGLVVDEAAFVVKSSTADIKFLTEEQWARQIYVLSSIKNSKACFQSRSDLYGPGDSGIDNFGKSVTFWEALWFALGSYLVGKNDVQDNSYFRFHYGSYSNIDGYYDEYDKIDLGAAVSGYYAKSYGGTNVYWREFEAGYVIVNPTTKDVASISLPESCKQRTHGNLNSDLDSLPDINSISLKSHRAAILYKRDTQSPPPPPPPPPSGDDNIRIWFEAEDGDLYAPMQSATDNDASSGEYIQTTGSSGGYAEYSFNIPEAGTYFIWGRTLATKGSRNSFYISADNGGDIRWSLPISANWNWNQAISAYFAAGQHTLIIKQRENRTKLDKILITNDPDYVPQGLGGETSPTSEFWFEAEDGELYSPMQSATDSNASSGEYIRVTSGSGGYAKYYFDVTEPGTFFIWGRILAPKANSDSFYISTDNGSDIMWNLPISSNWGWDQAISVYFNTGQHTLIIKQRENRAQLDKILITADPDYVPNG